MGRDNGKTFLELSENILDRNLDPSDVTQATSPESRQGEKTPVDLPPPAVQGHGIRTGESIDPGAARSSAAGFGAASASDGPLPAASDEDLLGTVYVGKYELVSIIGSGGMGVIYQGRQVFLDRIVAIKMLKSNLGGERARMRFHQEAKASSQLIHPGIVGIIDFGVDELDRPYMVMEYVEGCTFSDLLRERQYLSVKDSLPIFLEICDALSIAHHKGVVHRDLKPSNIMLVVGADDKVHIKLLDFGIAKLLDMQEQTLQSMTKTGEALGTPLYMSPEQILGNKVTSRSDLYSLGCMMYACLTGTPPFIGANKLATMEKHCTAKPLSLKQASNGREFAPGMEEIVLQLLEKDPLDRFESVDKVKDALISMAVQNRLIRKPPPQQETAGAGQLYMTGVIPEMPASVVSLVPNTHTTEIHDSSFEEAADRTFKTSPRLSGSRIENTAIGRYAGTLLSGASVKTLVLVAVAIVLVIFTGVSIQYLKLRSRTIQNDIGTQVSKTSIVSKPHVEVMPSSGTEASKSAINVAPRQAEINSQNVGASVEKIGQSGVVDQKIHQKLVDGALDSSLSFRGQSGLTEAGVRELVEFKFLTGLDLSGTKITDACVRHLAKTKLRLLNLDHNPAVTDASLHYICNLPTIKSLSLADTGISDRGMVYIAESRTIDHLRIGQNRRITDTGIRTLSTIKSRLMVLYLDGCNLTSAAAENLSCLKHLTVLDVSDNPRISSQFLRNFLRKSQTIEVLTLKQDPIDDSGIEELTRFSRLEILDISYIPLSERGLSALCKLKKLTTLLVTGCGLSGTALKKLTEAYPKAIVSASAVAVPDIHE